MNPNRRTTSDRPGGRRTAARRALRTTGAWSLVILTGAVGCGGGTAHPAPARTSAARAADASRQPVAAPPAASAARPAAADPARPLPVSDGRKVLYRTQGEHGSAQLTVLPRIPRGALDVAAVCGGPGAISVRLGTVASFTAACDAGPGVDNEIVLSSAKTSVPVSVTATTSEEWALNVAWTSSVAPPAG